MNKQLWSIPLCLLLVACLSQNPPPAIHYFQPVLPDLAEPQARPPIPLSLGRIGSSAYLHEEMVWRVSDVEVGFDDLNRWVEDPALLLREAFEVVLYQEAGFVYSTDPDAISADFHLRRFEERPGIEPVVCVQFMVTARRAAGATPDHREIHVHESMARGGAEAAATAMGMALYRAARELADHLRGG